MQRIKTYDLPFFQIYSNDSCLDYLVELDIPINAQFMSVNIMARGKYDGEIHFLINADNVNDCIKRRFMSYSGYNQNVPENMVYLGSYQGPDMDFARHVFEFIG